MFNETLVQENYSNDNPLDLVIFLSFMVICCLAGCLLIPKWARHSSITPI